MWLNSPNTCLKALRIRLAAIALLLVTAGAAAQGLGHLVAFLGAQRVALGAGHSCAIASGGEVLCWGHNLYGQRGTGDELNSAIPTPVLGLPGPATALGAGKFHACAIVTGDIWCWGDNAYGQLGDGTTNDSRIAVKVQGLVAPATAVSIGDYHTCAIVHKAAKCWGSNFYGMLGDGSGVDSVVPVDVSGLSSGVTQISARALHTCVMADGAAKCWGDDYSGQLGDGEPGPVALAPVQVSGLSGGVLEIAVGASHSCAILPGGVMRCWGSNAYGALGDGSNQSSPVPIDVVGLSGPVSAIALGAIHSCAKVADGVSCWGDNAYAQLGNGTDDSLVPQPVPGLTQVARIDAGGFHSCAQRSDTSLHCWGFNAWGQLGDGSAEYRTSPVSVDISTNESNVVATGSAHTCAAVGAGISCWGYNGLGDLGIGEFTLYESIPRQVAGIFASPASLAAGNDHTCAAVNGAAMCWGDNAKGQLGNGGGSDSATPLPVNGMDSGVSMVAAGGRQSCAIRDGGAWCWGYNGNGELGNGLTEDSAVPVPVSGLGSGVSFIAVGINHTCAVHDGAAKCWGVAYDGQLGDGSSAGIASTPVNVTGLGSGVSHISTGYAHTCAVVNGGAKCWGYDGYGQLGNGIQNDAQYTPDDVVGLAGGVDNIVAGDDISCVIRNASVLCWGADYSGDLGNGGAARSLRLLPTPVIGMSGIAAGGLTTNGTHACATVTGGGMRCWGDDYLGSLGIGRVVLAYKPRQVMLQDQLFGDAFD